MRKSQYIGFEAHNNIRSRVAGLRIMLLTNAAKLTADIETQKKYNNAVEELDILLKKKLSRPLAKWQCDTLNSYLDTLKDEAGNIRQDDKGVYKIPDEFVDILVKTIS